MNLTAWLSYLEKLHPTEIDLGLDRVREVATRLALDFSGQFIITIGGTNGKGSTARFLEKLIMEAGRSVGLYRSPHLLHFNERICINSIPVSDEVLCHAFAQVEQARGGVSLTYFEFGTLAALLLFSQNKPDYLLLEVGLGGRLDAVNILDADLALITNIAMDHMQWLGDTREQIGLEKAGIMRAGKPVLYGEPAIPASVSRFADELGARLLLYGRDFSGEQHGDKWNWHGLNSNGELQELSLVCKSQSMLQAFPANAALALQAYMLLGLQKELARIRTALCETVLPGRFQIIERGYTLVLDVAHNPHAMEQVSANLRRCFPGRRMQVLIAMLKDKDHERTLQVLLPHSPQWHVASLENGRGSSAKILYNALQKAGQKSVHMYDNVEQAFLAVEKQIRKDEVLLVTGSFYTVAAVLELV